MGACVWTHSRSSVLYPWRGSCPQSCGLCDDSNSRHWSSFDTPAPVSRTAVLLTSFDAQHQSRFVQRHPLARSSPLYQLAAAAMSNEATAARSNGIVEEYARMEMRRSATVGLNRPCWLASCPEGDPDLRGRLLAESRRQPGLHERKPVDSIDLRDACPWLSDVETTGIWFSGGGTHTSWTVESLNMTAVHTVLSGSETWALLPPGAKPPMLMEGRSFHVDPDAPMDPSRFVIHPTSWRNRSSQLKEALTYPGVITFMATAGDTVVVPSGWWMTWFNNEPTMALHDALITTESLRGTFGELRLGFERCRRMLGSKVRVMGEQWRAAFERSEL